MKKIITFIAIFSFSIVFADETSCKKEDLQGLVSVIEKMELDGSASSLNNLKTIANEMLSKKDITLKESEVLIDKILIAIRSIENTIPLKNEENDKIIKSRMNTDYAGRYALLAVLLELVDKHKDNISDTKMSEILSVLKGISKYDWGSGARRLAMVGFISFNKDKKENLEFLKWVKENDGALILNAKSFKNKQSYEFLSSKDKEGNRIYNEMFFAQYALTRLSDGPDQKWFKGVTEEELNREAGKLRVLAAEALKIYSDPENPKTKEFVERRMKEINADMKYYGEKSKDSPWYSSLLKEKEEIEKNRTPSASELLNIKKMVEDADYIKPDLYEYANGVTKHHSDDTIAFAKELERQITSGENLDFQSLYSQGKKEGLFMRDSRLKNALKLYSR